jgi:hypothetical protein
MASPDDSPGERTVDQERSSQIRASHSRTEDEGLPQYTVEYTRDVISEAILDIVFDVIVIIITVLAMVFGGAALIFPNFSSEFSLIATMLIGLIGGLLAIRRIIKRLDRVFF